MTSGAGCCLILGCGYTGRRVAVRLAARGMRVIATARQPAALHLHGVEALRVDLDEPATLAVLSRSLPDGSAILHSVPLLEDDSDPTARLLDAVGAKASRIVYLSTTGVYGATRDVDETTPIAPRTARETNRAGAEAAVLGGPWSALVLRPAAIYGPWRGVHASLREGRFRMWGDGANWVSRIHVDDLAALAEAALQSPLLGAFPVADEEPCRSIEIVRYCCEMLGIAVPGAAPESELDETRRANRKVDGRAVFRALGLALRYSSYRTGVPACLRLEMTEDRPRTRTGSRRARPS